LSPGCSFFFLHTLDVFLHASFLHRTRFFYRVCFLHVFFLQMSFLHKICLFPRIGFFITHMLSITEVYFMIVLHRTRFFPGPFKHIILHMSFYTGHAFFSPGYVFYKWVFYIGHALSPVIFFYTCVFLQMSFFLQSVFFLRSLFTGRFFYTWVFFTQYTTLLSYPGYFLHVSFFTGHVSPGYVGYMYDFYK
jgi:hypothetical protein